jgi:ribosome assembly protein YihI (activator of Der GTPase)
MELFTVEELKVLYDFLRSDDVFHAEGRSKVDFVVNRIAPLVERD